MRSSKKALISISCIVALTFIFSAVAEASTFTAMGTVTDANGYPLPNATVTLVDYNYKQVAMAHTDNNGNFEFASVEPGTATCKVLTTYTDSNGKTYSVPPEFSSWFAASGTVMINQTYTRITDYAAASFSAIGTVTDKNGNPVEGARVMLIDDNKKETAATRSDSNGNFEFVSMTPTTRNFTVSVLFINDSQSFNTSSHRAYPQSGTVSIEKTDTSLDNYSTPVVSQQTTVATVPVSTAEAETPVNVTALAISLLAGIVILAGAYLLLRKAL